jgi:hypothetical protein
MQTEINDIGIQLKNSIDKQISYALTLCQNKELSRKSVVRELRRSIKNVRSLFKLFRPVISEVDFHTTDEQIGKINRLLTVQREAWVNLKTYHRIEMHLSDVISQSSKNLIFNELTDYYNSIYSNKNNGFEKVILNVSFQLKKLQEKIRSIAAKDYSETLLYLAFEKSYAKTAWLYFNSKISLQSEIMHKWKRFNKYLTNQIIFISLFRDYQFDRLTIDLETLTDLLGKEHDLTILYEHITKSLQDKIDKKERVILQQVFDNERRKLQKAAFGLSNILFAKRIEIFKTEEVIVS